MVPAGAAAPIRFLVAAVARTHDEDDPLRGCDLRRLKIGLTSPHALPVPYVFKMPTPAATAPVEGTTAEPQAEDTVSPTPAIPTKTEAK